MAYINQETKKLINAELKKIVPKNWKYTLSITHHSSLNFNLKSADVDLLSLLKEKRNHREINLYCLNKYFSGDILNIFQKIKDVLNLKNWDKSDSQIDYFDVGYYVHINIGQYNKPFLYIQNTVCDVTDQENITN